MRERETIEELLEVKEGEHYQFKEWKTKDDLREATKMCCALANCGGGKLVLGITDKRPRKVVGSTAFPQPERTRADLMSKLHIGVDFFLHQHMNGRVIVFEVASRPIGLPIQADGIAWWYHGDSLIPMPEDIRHSIYAESDHDFSGEVCLGATIDDLDSDAIETFRKTWCEYSGNARVANSSVKQLLRDCGALTDGGVTYAALILFGKHSAIVKYLPHSEIVFEYRSMEAAGPAAQREDFCVAFFNSYDHIWKLVNLRNDKQHYQEGLHVFPVSTFNEQVVREGLLNAVTHRNYQIGGSIFVRQYSRRIVIESPGGFPWGITAENILDKHSARNKLIAGIFQLCGLVERAGQGMNMMYEMAIKEAKPLPDFTGSDPYSVKLTLSGKLVNSRMLALLKKIGDERLRRMSTDDYILLCKFYRGSDIRDIDPAHFDNLIDLGVINQTERGFELANGDIALLTDNNHAPSIDSQSTANRLPIDHGAIDERLESDDGAIDERLESDDGTTDRKRQIVDFITENTESTSSQIAKHTGLTQGHIRKIVEGLVADGIVEKIGNYRYARYTIRK